MRLLTNSPEHAGEAHALDAWTTMDHPESVRLAAMAAIDDLESGAWACRRFASGSYRSR